MGNLVSCCFGSSIENESLQPDIEVKRRQQAEAAERRLQEAQSKGIKNPSRFQEKQKRLEEMEAREEQAARQGGGGGGGLKWTVG